MYNTWWYFGSIIAAWITFGTIKNLGGSEWSWRVPSLVQAVPCIMQMFLVWTMPESPRWLISKGRELEAVRILAKHHASGDERDPLVVFEYTQIREGLRMEREVQKTTSIWALVRTPGNRRRMMIVVALALFSQWSGNGLVSYYIKLILTGVGVESPTDLSVINGSLQIFNFVVAVAAALLVDRIGRRTLFITSNAGMLLVFSMWTLTTALFQTEGNTPAAKATIPLIFMFYLFYDIAYTPLLVSYCIEILPFNVRAKGFAIMNMTVFLSLAFNQFVNPKALDALHWKYYLMYSGFLVFELFFVVTFLVETKDKTLEETAAIFDGEQRIEDLQTVATFAATQVSMRARDEIDHDIIQVPQRARTLGDKSLGMPSIESFHDDHPALPIRAKDEYGYPWRPHTP